MLTGHTAGFQIAASVSGVVWHDKFHKPSMLECTRVLIQNYSPLVRCGISSAMHAHTHMHNIHTHANANSLATASGYAHVAEPRMPVH